MSEDQAVEIRQALHNSAPFVVVVALYVVGGLFMLQAKGQTLAYSLAEIYRWPVTITAYYLLVTLVIAVLAHVLIGRRSPIRWETWRFVLTRWMGLRRLIGTLVVLVTLPAFLAVMYGFRLSLTLFEPFYLDPLFMRIDVWLHGGRHPWELLQPIIGYPVVTRWIDAVYVYGWSAVLWLGVIWQTVHGREPLRSQFLMTLVLAWILLGTWMAIAMSSAGPVYFGRVTGLVDPYEPLMAYLRMVDRETPLHAIAIQESLWASYTEWGGITAMPSMHLSIITGVILAGIRAHRWLALGLIPFGIIILVGSVHLGWHYAIDSYVGIGATVLLWWVSGHLMRGWQARLSELRVFPYAA